MVVVVLNCDWTPMCSVIKQINMWQVSGQLSGIERKLADQQRITFQILEKLKAQQKSTDQILEIVTELRFLEGLEDIEAVFMAFIQSMFLFICVNYERHTHLGIPINSFSGTIECSSCNIPEVRSFEPFF